MGKALQSLGHWSLKLFSLPQYAGLSSDVHLSLQHTPALTLPAEPQSVYLQPHNTLSTTAPTAQSRKCYQRQCMSGWLRSATLRVEQTAPYLSVCTVSRVTTTCPVIRKIYNVCVCVILEVYCFSSIQFWWHSCGCDQTGRTIQEK